LICERLTYALFEKYYLNSDTVIALDFSLISFGPSFVNISSDSLGFKALKT